MIDKTNTICDYDKIIINDSRTYLSGNLRVTKDGVFQYVAPQSPRENPELYDKIGEELTYPFMGSANKVVIEIDPKLFLEKGVKEFHFCNETCLLKWLEQNHQKGG